MNERRVIFVNRVFTPDESATAQLLHDLTTALAALRWRVVVITSRLGNLPRNERIQRVQVIRVNGVAARTSWLVPRAFHYLSCWIGLVRAVAREARPGDVIVVMSDPPLIGIGVSTVVRGRNAVIHWCQELHPEAAMAVSRYRWQKRLLTLLCRARDVSLRQAASSVVLGADMQRLMERRGMKDGQISICPNWPPLGTRPVNGIHLRRHWNLEGRFVVGYSGDLGGFNSLTPLLNVAARLRDDSRMAILLIGDGPQRRSLQRTVRRGRLDTVKFFPPQPRLRFSEVLAVSDLQVITLRDECIGTMWPSQFYSIVAAHRPVLFIGPPDADVAQLVVNHGLGGSFEPQDVEGIAAYVRRLADDPAEAAAVRTRVAAFADTMPGLAGALDHWIRLLEQTPVVSANN